MQMYSYCLFVPPQLLFDMIFFYFLGVGVVVGGALKFLVLYFGVFINDVHMGVG